MFDRIDIDKVVYTKPVDSSGPKCSENLIDDRMINRLTLLFPTKKYEARHLVIESKLWNMQACMVSLGPELRKIFLVLVSSEVLYRPKNDPTFPKGPKKGGNHRKFNEWTPQI